MINTVEQAISDFREGKMLILTDDAKVENDGNIVFAAEHVTPEKINFLLKHCRGLICVSASEDYLCNLGLKPLVTRTRTPFDTNFYDMIDAADLESGGISAKDQSRTIATLVRTGVKPSDFVRPGHVHTLGAREGGVLVRAGHTEGTVDLAKLSGSLPVGVLCEIMSESGEVARLAELKEFAVKHDIKIVSIKQLIEYRHHHEKLVKPVVTVPIQNKYGTWDVIYYEAFNGEGHVALGFGDYRKAGCSDEGILVRVHSQCFTGDTLGSYRCDCGPQLENAMKKIVNEGVGVILYMHQEGRGIGLKNKLLAYKKQDEGLDTVEANRALGFEPDLREYGIGAQMLADLGLKRIRLMTNNPRKIVGLEAYDINIVDRVPLECGHHEDNKRYLQTKQEKLGHLFKL